MTKIRLVANDQLLSVSLNPVLASGDQNTVKLHVDFSEEWDALALSAIFYTDKIATVYEVLFDGNGDCTIPNEVLAKSGTLFIGVRGVNADDASIKTSTLVKYKIKEGAPVGTATTVELTADVYQQMLTLFKNTTDEVNATHAEMQANFEEQSAEMQANFEEQSAEMQANFEEQLRKVGLSYTLLWENPNPTAEFAGQIITLGEEVMTKYPFFCITYKEMYSSSYDQFYVLLKNRHAYDSAYLTGVPGAYYNEQMLAFSAIEDGVISPIKRAILTTSDKTGINILDGRYMTAEGTAAKWNQHLIPCKIYGVVQNALTASDEVIVETVNNYLTEHHDEIMENVSSDVEKLSDDMEKVYGLGTSIPANSDLDSYTTVGNYYSVNTTNTSTLSNVPSGATTGFRLEVKAQTSATWLKQILYPNNISQKFWIRQYEGDTWTDWKQVAMRDDFEFITEGEKITDVTQITLGGFYYSSGNVANAPTSDGVYYEYIAIKNGWIISLIARSGSDDATYVSTNNYDGTEWTNAGWDRVVMQKDLPTPTWNAITSLTNGTVQDTTTTGYWVYGKMVVVQVRVKSGSITLTKSANTTLFTLPSGYRPSRNIEVPLYGRISSDAADRVFKLYISTDGVVSIYNPDGNNDITPSSMVSGQITFMLE